MNLPSPPSHQSSRLSGAILLFLSFVPSLAGCGPSIPQLRATASNEMNCPVSELEIERIDSDTMAAVGCGRETIYSKFCEKSAEGKTCGWRADPQADEAP
jgi:hypothetical protein